MAKVRDIIDDALRETGALSLSDTASALEYQSALRTLNRMLSNWSNDSLKCFFRVRESFPLVGLKSEFTIGPDEDADMETARPIKIVSAQVRLGQQSQQTYNLNITSMENYLSQVTLKEITGIPSVLAYDNNFPVAKIYIYPMPQVGVILELFSEKELNILSDLDEEVSFPPGWEEAIVYGLASRLCTQYGQELTQTLSENARNSLGLIKTAVARNRPLDWSTRRGNSNIYGGWSD
jgi:hypothetical protein